MHDFYNLALASWTAPLGSLGDDTEVSASSCGRDMPEGSLDKTTFSSAHATSGTAGTVGRRSEESFQPPGMLCQEKHSKLSAAKIILTSNVFQTEATKGAHIQPGDE